MILTIFIIICIIAILLSIRYHFGNPIKNGILINEIVHVSGIPDLNKDVKFRMKVSEENIIINNRQVIPLSRVNATEVIKSTELVEKERNIVGRALIGGIVFGGIGAIVSGMTGLKNDKKSQDVDILIINYKDINGNDSQIVGMATNAIIGTFLRKISKGINEIIGYIPSKSSDSLYEI